MVNATMLKIANFMSAQMQTKKSYTFWTKIAEGFISFLCAILNGFVWLVYHILKFVLNIIDLLQYFVKRLVGLDYWGTSKVTTENYADHDIIFRFLQNKQVQRVFRYMIGIFVVLLIVFTIIAIIKSEYSFAANGGDNNKKTIFTRSFKAIFMVIMVPILMTVGIMASNAVLQGVVNAFSLNNNITLGGQVFVGSAYNANKYKMYVNDNTRYATATKVTLYYKDGWFKRETIGTGLFAQTVPTYDEDCITVSYDEAVTNGFNKKISIDTTVPVDSPMSFGSGNRVSGIVFSGVKAETGTKFFWRTYTGSATNGDTKEQNHALIRYYIEKVAGYTIVNEYFNQKINAGHSGDEIISAMYNSWKYNEYLTQVWDFGQSTTSTTTRFVAASGISYNSAKTYTNSAEWSKFYDGGKNGLVALTDEYKVMGDFIDYMVQNCTSATIVDITNRQIDWDKVATTGNFNKFRAPDFISSKKFVVEYSNSGYVVYKPSMIGQSTDELGGSIYIMCYTDYSTGSARYIPVIANTNQKVTIKTPGGVNFDENYYFESENLGSSYQGLIVARGGFKEGYTNGPASAGYPTYIASDTKLTEKTDNSLNEIKAGDKYYAEVSGEKAEYFLELVTESGADIKSVDLSKDYMESGTSGSTYKWVSPNGAELALEDEFHMEDELDESGNPKKDTNGNIIQKKVYTRVGIKGELNPFKEVFKHESGNYYEPTGYAITDETGCTLFGFMVTVNKNTTNENSYFFYLRYNPSDTNNELSVVKCSDYYYYYYKVDTTDTTKYYMKNDGSFGSYVSTDDKRVKINFYDMNFQKVLNDGSVVVRFSGYEYGSNYYGTLSKSAGSSIYQQTSKGINAYAITVDYYDYFTFRVGNTYYKYDYNDKSYSPTTPMSTEKFLVIYDEDAVQNITLVLDKNDRFIRFTGDIHSKLKFSNYVERNGLTDADIIEAALNPNNSRHNDYLYSVYEDKEYAQYVKLKTFSGSGAFTDAIAYFKDISVNIHFINERPTAGIAKFDFYFNVINIFNKDAVFRLKIGFFDCHSASQATIVESFANGEFYLDYNFGSDGPNMGTMYAHINLDYLILIFACALLFKTLGVAVWGLISRIYEITLYYLVMPGIAAMYPLESGEKRFTSWRDELIKKILGTYGIMIGLNFFFILLDPIRKASKLFNAEDMARMTSGIGRLLSGSAAVLNQIVYIIFVLVAFTMLQTAPQLISKLVGGEDMLKKGKSVGDTVKSNSKQVAGDVSGWVSGKKMMEAGEKIKDFPKKMWGFVPGSAIIDKFRPKKQNNGTAEAGSASMEAGDKMMNKGDEMGASASGSTSSTGGSGTSSEEERVTEAAATGGVAGAVREGVRMAADKLEEGLDKTFHDEDDATHGLGEPSEKGVDGITGADKENAEEGKDADEGAEVVTSETAAEKTETSEKTTEVKSEADKNAENNEKAGASDTETGEKTAESADTTGETGDKPAKDDTRADGANNSDLDVNSVENADKEKTEPKNDENKDVQAGEKDAETVRRSSARIAEEKNNVKAEQAAEEKRLEELNKAHIEKYGYDEKDPNKPGYDKDNKIHFSFEDYKKYEQETQGDKFDATDIGTRYADAKAKFESERNEIEDSKALIEECKQEFARLSAEEKQALTAEEAAKAQPASAENEKDETDKTPTEPEPPTEVKPEAPTEPKTETPTEDKKPDDDKPDDDPDKPGGGSGKGDDDGNASDAAADAKTQAERARAYAEASREYARGSGIYSGHIAVKPSSQTLSHWEKKLQKLQEKRDNNTGTFTFRRGSIYDKHNETASEDDKIIDKKKNDTEYRQAAVKHYNNTHADQIDEKDMFNDNVMKKALDEFDTRQSVLRQTARNNYLNRKTDKKIEKYQQFVQDEKEGIQHRHGINFLFGGAKDLIYRKANKNDIAKRKDKLDAAKEKLATLDPNSKEYEKQQEVVNKKEKALVRAESGELGLIPFASRGIRNGARVVGYKAAQLVQRGANVVASGIKRTATEKDVEKAKAKQTKAEEKLTKLKDPIKKAKAELESAKSTPTRAADRSELDRLNKELNKARAEGAGKRRLENLTTRRNAAEAKYNKENKHNIKRQNAIDKAQAKVDQLEKKNSKGIQKQEKQVVNWKDEVARRSAGGTMGFVNTKFAKNSVKVAKFAGEVANEIGKESGLFYVRDNTDVKKQAAAAETKARDAAKKFLDGQKNGLPKDEVDKLKKEAVDAAKESAKLQNEAKKKTGGLIPMTFRGVKFVGEKVGAAAKAVTFANTRKHKRAYDREVERNVGARRKQAIETRGRSGARVAERSRLRQEKVDQAVREAVEKLEAEQRAKSTSEKQEIDKMNKKLKEAHGRNVEFKTAIARDRARLKELESDLNKIKQQHDVERIKTNRNKDTSDKSE